MDGVESQRRGNDTGPLPLVIGVTGHRDLRPQDGQILEAEVTRIFVWLQNEYSHTPFILLSPLAEGADRLVARVALQRGVRLIVPLPLPKELYVEDFHSEGSRTEFEELLQCAGACLVVRQLGDENAVRQPGEARDRQYAQVGAYIATHSQLLIALWDGAFTNSAGGTSQVVRFQLEGAPEPYAPRRSPLDEVESGPVLHVATPRATDSRLTGPALSVYPYYPDRRLDERTVLEGSNDLRAGGFRLRADFDRIFRRLDGFNADAVRLGPRLAQERVKSGIDLLRGREISTLPDGLQQRAEEFAVANTLAGYFRALTARALVGLLALAFVAASSFLFFHIWEYRWTLIPYLVALALSLALWFFWAKRADIHDKHLDYRALAEGLRVQIFWQLAGVTDAVAAHYLRKQRSELNWIRNSLRVADLAASDSCAAGSEGVAADYDTVQECWVDGQCAYFRRAAERNRLGAERKERWGTRLFAVGLLAGAALTVLLFVAEPWIHDHNWLRVALILAATLPPLTAALLESYADKMAYTEQAKQYQRMGDMFGLAGKQLTRSLRQQDYVQAAGVIRELGEEALRENGDWVVLHRTRRIDVPKGG